ncbi:DgyrCDS10042 [Dimorphilus gyrociliatus]|uniref:DgyrCDS10042 n=1 Tax=Dimorphilus gyrociliatus TaxID=2664684 RepID=A0A7I8W124_9ANNE|nr:DgyrCDS10042 [Dimorphilus gyrociliatus]
MQPSSTFDKFFPFIVFGWWFLVIIVIVSVRNLYFRIFPNVKYGLHYIRGLPFVGTFFISVNRPHLTLTKFVKRYGAMYWMKVLGKDMLVISEPESIYEAMHNSKLGGRPHIWRVAYGFHFQKDIIFGDGLQKWAYMKKVAAAAVRKFQDNTLTSVEANTKKELDDMIQNFQTFASKNVAFDPALLVLTAVVNIVAKSATNTTYRYDDEPMKKYKKATEIFSQICSPIRGFELEIFPLLRHLPMFNMPLLTEGRAIMDELIDTEFRKVQTRWEKGNPKCFLDYFLDDPQLEKNDVRSIFLDLIVSATYTTSIALNSFLLLMAVYPEEQDKLRTVIYSAIQKKWPTIQDKEKMIYVQATVLELLRYLSHVPLSLPHLALEDTEISGYYVPKNSEIILNLWAMHHNPKIFPNPWSFKPSRFISNGVLINHKYLLPFGAGKRHCLGESLAKERLFMFFVVLLQNFEIYHDNDNFDYQTCADPRSFLLGIILQPDTFKIRMRKLPDEF